MKAYQTDLIKLLLSSGALCFGDFTLKSGRKSPYFINTGRFDSGSALSKLGAYYAKHLVENSLADADFLFGPAYKGIPLAVAAAAALFRDFDRDVAILYDRKEIKDHADVGKLVGRAPKEGQSAVIIEDVITAGTTMREVVPLLSGAVKLQIKGVVLLADRCERGTADLSAVEEVRQKMGIKVFPMLTIYDIKEYVTSEESGPARLSPNLAKALEAYLQEYAPRS